MKSYKLLENSFDNHIEVSYSKKGLNTVQKIGVGIGSLAIALSLYVSQPAQKVINTLIPSNTNISQVIAAELQQKPYQIFEDHIKAVFDANRNSWLMEQEAEFKDDPRFQKFKDTLNNLLNYPNPNHKLLMDLDKITSIKFKPNKTNGGYDAVAYVGPMLAENAITVSAGEIFNIPDGVDIGQYMSPIFDDAFYFDGKYENLLKERKDEADKEAKKNELIKTRQNVISNAQQAKQRTIDDYTSGNLKSTGGSIVVVDLDDFNKKINVYNVENANEMLKALDIPNNAIISYNKVFGIVGYNLIFDYNNLDDGKNQIKRNEDGFTFLFDVPNAEQGFRAVSRIQKSRLESLITTDDAGAVISDILADKNNTYYIIRNFEDEKPSFGIFSVPIDMRVKVGEILARYINGVTEGYDGARFIFPASVSKDGGGSVPPVTPVTPVIPVTPIEEECENVQHIVNNADPIDTTQDGPVENLNEPLPDFTI